MYSIPKRPDRLSRDTSVSSDTSTNSDMSTTDPEAPFLRYKTPLVSQKTRSKRLLILVCLSLFMGAASLLSCVLLYTGVLQIVVKHSPEKQPTCVPCQSLLTTPFLEQDDDVHLLNIHFENRTMICCAKTPQQFSVMFNKLIQRKTIEDEVTAAQKADVSKSLLVHRGSSRVGAHLLAGLQPRDGKSQVRGWMSKHPLSYLTGLRLLHDRLVVEHGGLYLVYSQMYFKVNMEDSTRREETPKLLGHQVNRYNVNIPNGGKQNLLQAAHSCCSSTSSGESLYFHTSHVAGVFQLSSRDEIYVTVSDPTLIYRDPTRSYIGVFKLD